MHLAVEGVEKAVLPCRDVPAALHIYCLGSAVQGKLFGVSCSGSA